MSRALHSPSHLARRFAASSTLDSARRLATIAAATATLLAAGCATTQLDAQWHDPQLQASFLRGARVYVACDAAELVVRQICQDQLVAEVTARGATPVLPPGDLPSATTDRSLDLQLLDAARSADTKAVMVMTVAPASNQVSSGFQLGIGGFGYGGGGGSVGVGASIPVGGGKVTTGYTASRRLTDTGSGRLLWTAKATSPPSSDLNAQMVELSKTTFGAAEKAGLF